MNYREWCLDAENQLDSDKKLQTEIPEAATLTCHFSPAIRGEHHARASGFDLLSTEISIDAGQVDNMSNLCFALVDILRGRNAVRD
jgi:hypothetical protein